MVDASVPTFYWLCAEGPVSILSICIPMIFFLGRRLIRDGPSALFSSSTGTSQMKIKSGGTPAEHGGNAINHTLPSQNSQGVEMGKLSFDSTQGIFTGPGQSYDVSATRTSPNGSLVSRPLPEIPSIYVRNEVSVNSQP